MDSKGTQEIPWRIPYWGTNATGSGGEYLLITLNLVWASLVRPGDRIEAVSPYDLLPLFRGMIKYYKRVRFGDLTDQELEAFTPGASRDEVRRAFGQAFNASVPDDLDVLVMDVIVMDWED